VAVLLRDLLDRHVQAVLLEQAGLLGQRQRREAGPAGDADVDLGVLGQGARGGQASAAVARAARVFFMRRLLRVGVRGLVSGGDPQGWQRRQVRKMRASAPRAPARGGVFDVGRQVAVLRASPALLAQQRVRGSSGGRAAQRAQELDALRRGQPLDARMCARWRSSAAAGAPRRWPSTHGLPGWRWWAGCRRWPGAPATCSRWPARPR
jgi:hypothetical protein